jgi:hypothetical protein
MYLSNFSLEVLINGKPLKEYYHDGNYFIEGREKSSFMIKVTNRLNTKTKVILSVDGLSVIDGNEAGENSQGYVINPYSNIEIQGWRTSDEKVAEFYFSSKKKSYNNRSGQNNVNVGVIGAMLFPEKVKPVYWTSNLINSSPFYGYVDSTGGGVLRGLQGVGMNSMHFGTTCMDSSPTVALASAAAAPENNIGTGWGSEVESKVTTDYTEFYPNPSQILCLYYDDREGLEKRGIVVDPRKSYPNAFPTYSESSKYAKRPTR